MNKDEIRKMANTCAQYRACSFCPYNPEDISRFIGDRWKGGCPNYDRKIVYAMDKGYRQIADDEIIIKKSEYETLLLEQKRLKEIVDRIPCGYELKEITRQKTAREFADALKNKTFFARPCTIGHKVITIADIDETLNEFITRTKDEEKTN